MNKNNWYVITGAPSSGKTTILKELEKKGHKVYFEWARIYIDTQLKKGLTLSQIRKDEVKFQEEVLKLKVNFEKKLNKSDTIFIERGIPDTTAYLKLLKSKPSSLLKKALKSCHYKKVFLLELLKYETDYARTESQEEAFLLEQLLEESYRELKIPVIRVPKLPVTERAKFILDNL